MVDRIVIKKVDLGESLREIIGVDYAGECNFIRRDDKLILDWIGELKPNREQGESLSIVAPDGFIVHDLEKPVDQAGDYTIKLVKV